MIYGADCTTTRLFPTFLSPTSFASHSDNGRSRHYWVHTFLHASVHTKTCHIISLAPRYCLKYGRWNCVQLTECVINGALPGVRLNSISGNPRRGPTCTRLYLNTFTVYDCGYYFIGMIFQDNWFLRHVRITHIA